MSLSLIDEPNLKYSQAPICLESVLATSEESALVMLMSANQSIKKITKLPTLRPHDHLSFLHKYLSD